MQKLIIVLPLYTIEISGEHETEIFKRAAFWSSLPTKCPHCERPLILNYRTPQTFEYYELRCTGDKVIHCVNLGESKGSHNLYYDPKKQWYSYNVGEAPGDRNNQATPEPASRTGTPNERVPMTPTNVAEIRPGVVGSVPAPVDVTAKSRNDLLKLIKNCKDAGIRSGLNAADVGALDADELIRQIERLGNLLLHGTKQT